TRIRQVLPASCSRHPVIGIAIEPALDSCCHKTPLCLKLLSTDLRLKKQRHTNEHNNNTKQNRETGVYSWRA
ncbi:MAG: hypothetical protein VYE61_06190, partial [Pseudomonadota bacterium]|nr:hypothetical protein [Pseudomonadota bacterium]